MVKWIKTLLDGTSWRLWTDGAHSEVGGNTGNLCAYLEANPGYKTIIFSAHLDTVAKKEDKIKVRFDGKVFKSDGKTILGADNKAGVITLVNMAMNLDKSQLKNNLLLYFPVREEAGRMGSSLFHFNRTKIKYVFNVDGGDEVGTFVYKSLGYLNFKIELRGKAAHAAKEYNKGKNSITAASKLISKLPHGTNEEKGTTLNVGKIKGGTATNVVPDYVVIEGEFRAFENEQINKFPNFLKKICDEISSETGVSIRSIPNEDKSYAAPFRGSRSSQICKVCAEASKKIGIKPVFKAAYYTSDANHFSEKGLETIVVSRGGKNAHSKNEEIRLRELEISSKLVQELAYTS